MTALVIPSERSESRDPHSSQRNTWQVGSHY